LIDSIRYIDRLTGKVENEEIFAGTFLRLLYGSSFFTKIFSPFLQTLFCKSPFFSKVVGAYQHLPWTKKKIAPFIKRFHVDPTEFQKELSDFNSFNDFFIRKLKPEARPIDPDPKVAIIPADGRYLFFPHIEKADGFLVKGKKFLLEDLLKNREQASEYAGGTLVLARLCPTDYHRYHFPCDTIPGIPHLIKGDLYSVNPLALRKRIEIFTENKRVVTPLMTNLFGKILWVEVGATCVGTIHQTFEAGAKYKKGEEKGFFSFGGSSLVLLFRPGTITLDADLLAASERGLEIRCLIGQSMGRVSN
jgi:phosphatidylserine decarboxylase